ncbi:MAG: protein phosphatase 2C domain-containing protein [Chloroflexi bacterium]|nr:protein phosphatase 2C domain-containing protein [Chloroflexota bacterium]
MLAHATIIGRSHRLMQHNSHDFAISDSPRPSVAFGLVLDGCGGKVDKALAHSEVGAKLLGRFMAEYLSKQLSVNGKQFCLETLLDGLYHASLSFLQGIVDLYAFPTQAERAQFVAVHLLATLVGFVAAGDEAVFFWQGDGYLAHNGEITTLDSQNQPDYLAYQLLRTDEERSNGRFHAKSIANPKDIEWLAVATDGWRPELLAELAEPRASLALQRWLNVQARQRGNFEDDGAVTVWLRHGQTSDFLMKSDVSSHQPHD